MSSPDFPNIARTLGNLNYGAEIFETLIQGLANHLALERAMETILSEEVFLCRPEDATATGCTAGARLTDPTKLYYYGLSQGHIFGTTVVAYTSKITRGVLGVGGGNYSTMLERSSDWPTYKAVLSGTFPDPFDVVLAINLFQQRWDFTETSGVANNALAATTNTPPSSSSCTWRSATTRCPTWPPSGRPAPWASRSWPRPRSTRPTA
jgi:hypothetical protein